MVVLLGIIAAICFFGAPLANRSEGTLLSLLFGSVSLLLMFWAHKFINTSKSEERINMNNDGVYSISASFRNNFSKILIDANDKTISLESEGKKKTYHFYEITSFEYKIGSLIKFGYDKVNWPKTYYSIKTTDPEMPVWYFRFTVRGNMNSPQYYLDLEKLYEKWHQIIDNVLNNKITMR